MVVCFRFSFWALEFPIIIPENYLLDNPYLELVAEMVLAPMGYVTFEEVMPLLHKSDFGDEFSVLDRHQ